MSERSDVHVVADFRGADRKRAQRIISDLNAAFKKYGLRHVPSRDIISSRQGESDWAPREDPASTLAEMLACNAFVQLANTEAKSILTRHLKAALFEHGFDGSFSNDIFSVCYETTIGTFFAIEDLVPGSITITVRGKKISNLAAAIGVFVTSVLASSAQSAFEASRTGRIVGTVMSSSIAIAEDAVIATSKALEREVPIYVQARLEDTYCHVSLCLSPPDR